MSTARRWVYLTLLLLGYSAAGWLLAAFQVHWWVWLVTFGLTLHLIRCGPAAIVPASAWVTGVMFVAAVTKAWAPLWGLRFPYEHAQLWALGLLLIWLGAIVSMVLLALAPPFVVGVRERGEGIAAYSLSILVGTALAGGGLLY
ncbi:hypothetical protein [uncultured Thiodictyon sp.]|uniref:hypothetical protein n=1 Tax=uncultured Thiodictyon sp. TaxID=1846217 RepID=UPI0025DB8F5F|nr:hypothetical protein [uncultured Thiodictyon sp.]